MSVEPASSPLEPPSSPLELTSGDGLRSLSTATGSVHRLRSPELLLIEGRLRNAAMVAIKEGIGPDGFHLSPCNTVVLENNETIRALMPTLGLTRMTYQMRANITRALLLAIRPIPGISMRSHAAKVRQYITKFNMLINRIALDRGCTKESVLGVLNSTS